MKQITPTTVTVGVLAILFGLAAAYGARHFLSQAPLAGESRKMATVVVPKVNLPKYVRIRERDIEEVEVPVETLPEGAVRLKSRALFRLLKSTVMAGQPLLEDHLFSVGEVPLLSDQLPPGYRAVTLSVDAKSALNGMIQPDSSVDIALTVNSDRPEVGGLATLTLLRGVRVLATSEARFPTAEDRAGQLRNVTVAVTPEQANKLILAQRYGTLSVTLRSTLEDAALLASSDAHNDLVNPTDLLGLSPLMPVPDDVPQTKTVEIWRGGTMQQVTFDAPKIQEALDATAASEDSQPAKIVPISTAGASPASETDSRLDPADRTAEVSGVHIHTFGHQPDRPTPAPPIGS